MITKTTQHDGKEIIQYLRKENENPFFQKYSSPHFLTVGYF